MATLLRYMSLKLLVGGLYSQVGFFFPFIFFLFLLSFYIFPPISHKSPYIKQTEKVWKVQEVEGQPKNHPLGRFFFR